MIRNTHRRTLPVPASTLAPLLAGLGGSQDLLWPAGWPPLRLDGPVAVGAAGGHGPIRYRVSTYEPGRRVRFTMDPACGLRGHHELVLEPRGSGCELRHELVVRPLGSLRVLGPTLVLPLHDALIEDLLDRAERFATGGVAAPARWSARVRSARWVMRRVRLGHRRRGRVPAVR